MSDTADRSDHGRVPSGPASGPVVFDIDVPQYRVDTEPDHRAVGRVVDAELRKLFLGRTVVVRGIGAQHHPGRTVDDLIEIVCRLGTDRYDPDRAGDRYDNLQNKRIDLFAFRRRATPRMRLFEAMSWGFYHSSIAVHGVPVRLDLLLIYDAAQLREVVHQYEGRDDRKRDGYVFRDPDRKPEALLGIAKLSR
ncbi:hypothetical protein [Actinopolymorpha singaporensis]|uniref:Uncharacterized protein n=1 Tax=Actinopolymorpha singaporensis TaxID=117157 RepID=A0A1H1YL55_9ACTN|nr:hypothetical protein [Actinopolymorpha singaporensis]SDT22163.1 hypothetical protein SAMN04489717_5556 [Actinopolymorpha singaporensis]